MKLTQDWFEQQGACLNGLCWVRAQFLGELKELEAAEIINRLIAQKNEITECYKTDRGCPENSLHWANWTICRVFSREQRIKYAIFAAEQVIHIYEERYPDDGRPRNAIEAAKKYLEDPLTSNVVIASAVAADAAANAAAAHAAASAAAHAAAHAAAIYTAYAAANAAADAAAHTAHAANVAARAADKTRKRILKYGLELLQA